MNDQNYNENRNPTTNHQLGYLEIFDHPAALKLQNVDYMQPDYTVDYEFRAEK